MAAQGSPIPGILQARTQEWVAISFSNAWKWKVKVKKRVISIKLFTNVRAERRGLKHADFSLTSLSLLFTIVPPSPLLTLPKFSPSGPVSQENYLQTPMKGLWGWVEEVVVCLCLVQLWDWNQAKLLRCLQCLNCQSHFLLLPSMHRIWWMDFC